MRRLNLRQLEAFRALMLGGTTTRASVLLGVSQPSISRLIDDLEIQLGVNLFVRERGRLFPTEEAQWLFTEAQEALTRLDRLDTAVRDIRYLSIGELNIVAAPPIAHSLVPRALERLRGTYPDLRVSIQVTTRREVRDWTSAQRFDIALPTLPIDYPEAKTEMLSAVDCVCIMPIGHPLAEKKVVHAADLADTTFVSLIPELFTRIRLDRLFEEAGVRRSRMFVEVQSTSGVCTLVASGLGVSIVDPFTAAAFQPFGLIVRPFLPRFEMEYGMLFPIGRSRTRLAAAFAQAAKDIVAEAKAHPGTGEHSMGDLTSAPEPA
jgi:DNA-binding transcriptional LysR family regulator